MATSWTLNAAQLRDTIGRKLGIIGVGQTMPAEDVAVIYQAMDARLKELHSLGILWWNVAGATTSISLSAGVQTATIGQTDYLFPVSLMLSVGTSEQPIRIVGHSEWHAIPEKSDQGEPELAFISGTTVHLYPIPQANYTAKLTYQSIAVDVAAGSTPDVPVSMLRSLAILVASDLADEFGLSEQAANRLASQVPGAIRTIKALKAERVDPQPVTPEHL